MKKLIITISECVDCPYCVRCCCEYVKKDFDLLATPTDFPDWCPLPDITDPAHDPAPETDEF